MHLALGIFEKKLPIDNDRFMKCMHIVILITNGHCIQQDTFINKIKTHTVQKQLHLQTDWGSIISCQKHKLEHVAVY